MLTHKVSILYYCTLNSIKKNPIRADEAYKIPTILIFSLKLLFVLNSTARPIPAPEQRPAQAAPKDKTPSLYNSISATETEQLGIKPKRLATKG